MRLRIGIETPIIPIIYRHRILSLIKEALKKANFKENKSYFCFNLSLPSVKDMEIASITIDEDFSINDFVFKLKTRETGLFISSIDEQFINAIKEGIKKIKVFHFSSNKNMLVNGNKIFWKIKNVKVIDEHKINTEEVIFKTNSPILLEKDNRPILYNEQIFEQVLNENIRQRFLKILNREPRREIKFQPISMNKVVIKHTLKSFRNKTGKAIMYLTANAGTFKLIGDTKDLEIIYKIGLGLRTNQGFGMINVLT